ncbi:hypothetical protein EV361DRAFT_897667 [Lentinula raphanica]|uniref:Secreted protein n=1 Tax=Lentinula raphanica TaxID=153919 RepID=A0AA38U996_9AGAR|nr:hypothetical protein F5878DRAFT_728457 [Lentinula raphanica]KAJ3973849.1 hypothetical protein EV361DRAFT_897667 [Lentinula raphanica]
MTRLTLRAILILGLLSSGVLAAPASTRPSSKDQALCPCSNRLTGESESAPGVLKARGCCCSCYRSMARKVEERDQERIQTLQDLYQLTEYMKRPQATVDSNSIPRAVENINQIMPQLGHEDKKAADAEEVVTMLMSLPEPVKPLAVVTQQHYRQLIEWVTVLSNCYSPDVPHNPYTKVLEKLKRDSEVIARF